MLTRDQKHKVVRDLTQELKAAKGVVFSDFQGLPAKDIQELRALLRKDNIKHKVVKLSLLKRAMNVAEIDSSSFDYHLPVAVSWSGEDEVTPAKILQTFGRTHDKLKMVAGILDGKLIDQKQVASLASLPTKQELRAQVVGAIAGPLRGFVGVLSGTLRQLVYVLNAVKESKN